MTVDLSGTNPFLRYRHLLDSYAEAQHQGWSDEQFVDLVGRLDDRVAAVAGHGFSVTPIQMNRSLAGALDLRTDALWIKDETNVPGGSHKARHLFGTALRHAVDGVEGQLAIASCGNAAVSAATIARALDRELRVFVPTWAEPEVLSLLDELGATVEACERRADEEGDPAYLRFVEAVDDGAVPFSVQGTMTPSTIDGGRTIGWELAEQLHQAQVEGTIRLFAQVGGGALSTAAWQGLLRGEREWGMTTNSVLHAVQTEAAAPLPRAWDLLTGTIVDLPLHWAARAFQLSERTDAHAELRQFAEAAPELFMQTWEDPGHSAASGILDDVTYDWLTIVMPMIESGGWPIVVTEGEILSAHMMGSAHTDIEVSATGTAGLAGLFDKETRSEITPEDHLVVLFTGIQRS